MESENKFNKGKYLKNRNRRDRKARNNDVKQCQMGPKETPK